MKNLRICRTCKNAKPLSEYGVRNASADGKMTMCKVCDRAAQKVQYANNKKYYLDRNRIHRKRNRDRYNALKAGAPCAHCGGVFPAVCMDHDHIDPNTKKLCVAQMMGYSWKMIKDEIAKCELLCANCHRIKTYETTVRQKQHRITTDYKRNKR